MTFLEACAEVKRGRCAMRVVGHSDLVYYAKLDGKGTALLASHYHNHRTGEKRTEIGSPCKLSLLLADWELCGHPEVPEPKNTLAAKFWDLLPKEIPANMLRLTDLRF